MLRAAIAAAASAGALLIAEPAILGQSDALVTTADARIGRPLTPLSYAGVARRTTRRAIYGAPVVVVRPPAARRCVQVTDAYGRRITRCY